MPRLFPCNNRAQVDDGTMCSTFAGENPANHSEGIAERCKPFPPALIDALSGWDDARAWLPNSRPKERAPLKPRKPSLRSLSSLKFTFPCRGAGEMSMAIGDWTLERLEGARALRSGECGGEFKDIDDAKEFSRSEERKSSSSLAGRCSRCDGLRDGAGGG